jgi:hypothetical protein
VQLAILNNIGGCRMTPTLKRVRTEDGPRVVEEADYKGRRIKVASGYNVVGDNYIVHLYITPPGGPEVRIFEPPRTANTLDDALNLGFFVGMSEVDQLVP